MKKHKTYLRLIGSILLSILMLGFLCPQDQDSDQPSDEDFLLITPFRNMSDMGSINEAFSMDSNCPWG
ncbi:MAG: hypothetical protein P8078_12980, partial [bacterium]